RDSFDSPIWKCGVQGFSNSVRFRHSELEKDCADAARERRFVRRSEVLELDCPKLPDGRSSLGRLVTRCRTSGRVLAFEKAIKTSAAKTVELGILADLYFYSGFVPSDPMSKEAPNPTHSTPHRRPCARG